jgi:hypothetical protein
VDRRPEIRANSADFFVVLCYVRLSEHGTNMTLFTPLEDFMHRTISSVEGMWSKLEYVADLRQEGGGYEHWGLARVFGHESAERAIAVAHRNLVLELLRTPLPKLMEEARLSARQHDMPVNMYVQGLYTRGEELLPERLGGGSVKHFNSVLLALSALAACHPMNTAATHQAS